MNASISLRVSSGDATGVVVVLVSSVVCEGRGESSGTASGVSRPRSCWFGRATASR